VAGRLRLQPQDYTSNPPRTLDSRADFSGRSDCWYSQQRKVISFRNGLALDEIGFHAEPDRSVGWFELKIVFYLGELVRKTRKFGSKAMGQSLTILFFRAIDTDLIAFEDAQHGSII
jgi:hypothetical protein